MGVVTNVRGSLLLTRALRSDAGEVSVTCQSDDSHDGCGEMPADELHTCGHANVGWKRQAYLSRIRLWSRVLVNGCKDDQVKRAIAMREEQAFAGFHSRDDFL